MTPSPLDYASFTNSAEPKEPAGLLRKLLFRNSLKIKSADFNIVSAIARDKGNADIPVEINQFTQMTEIPEEFSLKQNYPNPFNPTTTIEYSIPFHSDVSIKVYDLPGREIATVVSEEKAPGNYKIIFNGNRMSSGVYFYRMICNYGTRKYSEVKKLLLLK